MKSGRFTRNVALVSGAGLAVVPMAFAATPSLAAADCGEGAEITTGLCEKAFTTAGDYTITVPASVSKMSAVLVGGGQGGVDIEGVLAYGGGGGISDPFSPQVLIQSGSPQEFLGWHVPPASLPGIGSGGGAGGTPTDCVGGPGLTASEVAAGSSLFPAVLGEPELGQGGSCSGITVASEAGAGKGGDVFGDVSNIQAEAGSDGAVILRWAAAPLPDTGMNAQPWVIGASVAAVLGGAVLASGALRVRRQGRHSN